MARVADEICGKNRSWHEDFYFRFSNRHTDIIVAVRKCYVAVSTDSYGYF